MDNLIARPFGKRAVLAGLFVAVLAAVFWMQSRYPSLNDKALMSGAIHLEDPLSFEAYMPLVPSDAVWRRVLVSTLNWLMTNRQGMTFGLLFAAAFMTMLGYLRRRSFEGRHANALLGLLLGAPLGVCVNCAAPIARGLYSAGARAETTLAAMVASPTMNIVVLTMLFSLLPFYMAVAKVALSLLAILVLVPLIVRALPQKQLNRALEGPAVCALPMPTGMSSPEGFPRAISGFVLDYLRNLWTIVKSTVPLMVLAGFLGALVATLLPLELLKNVPFGILAVVATAVVGTFLPVPIGFDVVVSGALLNGGLAPGYVMSLLFTLGVFSIYSFFIVATTISVRAAAMLGAVVVALGIVSGLSAQAWHAWQTERALRMLAGLHLGLIPSAHAASDAASSAAVGPEPAVTVTRRPFAARSPPAAKPFTRLEARRLGIDTPLEFSFADMWPPFWDGRGITAGDFDRDGNVDIVLASTERGLYFFKGDGKGRFHRVEMAVGPVEQMPVFNAALVDLDNDGWLDLFITTFRQGNHVLHNVGGRFDAAAMSRVKNRDDAVLTFALSFGDVDRDGLLDAAIGNWAAGWYRRIPGEEARNRIVFGEPSGMTGARFHDLAGLPGETLSMLLSDIDMDGKLDLLEGNDFEIPDQFHLGDGKGGFRLLKRSDGIVPMTTTTTMAIKTADLHNLGRPSIYLAQIAGRSSGVSRNLDFQPFADYCKGIEHAPSRQTCETNIAIKSWYKSGHSFDPTYAQRCLTMHGRYRDECRGMLVKDLAIQRNDAAACGLVPVSQVRARQYCDVHFLPRKAPTASELAAGIPQINGRNVLLAPKADGTFEEQANSRGLAVGGWSWDVKIADFDNDGWLDVYIVNGTWVPNEITPSNLFYRNTGQGRFEAATAEFGLRDYLITNSAVVIDIDNDGDLDLVTVTINGPTMAFINNSQRGNALRVALVDHTSNRNGVGAKLFLRHGATGERRQMRELQSGGGYMSFEPAIAHFGLGQDTEAHSLEIHWPTGERSLITEGLAAGATITVERGKR